MSKTILKLGASIFALSLLAAPGMAQGFDEWDADDDAGIAEEEFAAGFGEAGVYGEWDEDDDEALSEDEFAGGVYGIYDEDDDEVLDEEEFGAFEEDGWF